MQYNPYSAPLADSVRGPGDGAHRSYLSLRVVLYTHMASIVVCALLSLVDTLMITLPAPLMSVLRAVALPALLTWFVCPIAMLAECVRLRAPSNIVAIALIVEVVLVFAHSVALLPTVM